MLARRVGADGRTRAQINGRTASVADLRRLGAALLTFYGQHEHRKLTLAAEQLETLDGYCGPEQATRRPGLRAPPTVRYGHVREARRAAMRELEDARERELDLLEHELAEIEEAAPQEGEPERLRAERERLRQLDALLAAAGQAAEALAGGQSSDASDAPGAAALSAQATASLEVLAGADPQLDALAVRARALAIEAGDLAGSCVPTASGWRKRPRGARERARPADCRPSKSGWRRSSACCASTAPRVPPWRSTPSAHAPDASSCREPPRRSGRRPHAYRPPRRRCRSA